MTVQPQFCTPHGRTPHFNERWTDEQIEDLKKLNAKGLTRSEIAARLGNGLTRNAVIGKLLRLGIHPPGRLTLAKDPRNLWKPEEIELVKAGLTDDSIMAKTGRTRQAIQLKRSQLGLAKHTRGSNPNSLRPKTRALSSYRTTSNTEVRKEAPIEAPPEPRGDKPTLMDLKAAECKWPFGDPRHPEFHFCGADTGDIERPYCHGHARQAYARFSPP